MPDVKSPAAPERSGMVVPSIAMLLFLLLFISPPAAAPTSDTTAKKDDKPAAAAPTTRPRPLQTVLADFFDDQTTSTIDDPFAYADAHEYALEYMIVAVPDPRASSFDYTFDRHLDSVRYALEGEGYLLDRSRLPIVANGADGTVSPWEQSYGVVLLRHKSEHRLYALILIGETPTSGIHKKAFRAAVDDLNLARVCSAGRSLPTPFSFFLRAFQGFTHARPSTSAGAPTVAILGPTFSGSTDSLRLALRDAELPLEGCDLEIVSGSASDARNRTSLLAATRSDGTKFDLDFHAAVAPDNLEFCAVYDYVQSALHVPPERIALLRESNTAYGRDVSEQTTSQTTSQERPTCVQPAITIPFPMHIAELRNAEKDHGGEPAAPATQFARRLMQLSLDNPNAAHAIDRMPTQSDLTKFSVELQLATIFRTLCGQDISALGLIATDSKDVIELAQQSRKYCPGLQLFAVGTDNFFFHDDLTADLKEMVIASTYPLYDRNHLWSGAANTWHNLIQFPTEASQGVYNAALILFGLQPWYRTLPPTDEHNDLVEYGLPFAANSQSVHPPVWISAIGNGGVWPLLDVPFDANADKGYVYRAIPGTRDERARAVPPSLFMFLMLITSLVVVAGSLGIWFAAKVDRRKLANWSRVWLLFEPLRDVAAKTRDARYAALGLVLITALFAQLTTITWTPILTHNDWIKTELYALRVTMYALLAVLSLAIYYTGRALGGRSVVVAFAAATIIVAGPIVGACAPLIRHPELAVFRFERFTNLASGLSVVPTTLMLIVTTITVIGYHLRRLQIARLFDVFVGSWKLQTNASAITLDERVKRRTHLSQFLGTQNYLLLAGFAAIPLIAVMHKTRLPFEGRIFGFGMHAFYAFIYVATVLLAARLFTLWHDARAMLAVFTREPWFEKCRAWESGGPLDGLRAAWAIELEAGWTILAARLRELRDRVTKDGWLAPDADRLTEFVLLAIYVRRQLTALLSAITVVVLAALVLMNCYPFEMEHTLVATTWWVAVLLAGLMIVIVIEQNRNEAISVLDGSQPNRLTFDREFFSRIGLHGLLPILALAAAHSPTMSQFANSWLQPLLRFFGN